MSAAFFLSKIEFVNFQKSAENAQILCNENQNKMGQAKFSCLHSYVLSILGYCATQHIWGPAVFEKKSKIEWLL